MMKKAKTMKVPPKPKTPSNTTTAVASGVAKKGPAMGKSKKKAMKKGAY